MTQIRLFAPAKVNLFLGVGALLPDGYHEVDTVLHALELADLVVIAPSDDRLRVTCLPDVGVSEQDNIAYRAAAALGDASGNHPRVSIHISKRIPDKAGLGGGSSDAAAVLLGLARLWGLEPGGELVQSVARSLGADVAFFLQPSPCRMTGRGDLVSESLPAVSSPVVLVRPRAVVSTAAAYRAFDEQPVERGDVQKVMDAMRAGDVGMLGTAVSNNMETASCAVAPAVCEALAWTRSCRGVLGAAVAGSGSAVFALMGSEQEADDVARAASERDWWATATRLSPAGARVTEEEGGE